MATVDAQKGNYVYQTSASLAAAGSATSGSFTTFGYARIVGIHISNASAKAASGLRIWQSGDGGVNFDYFTDFVPSASSGSAFSVEVIGNAAKIDYITDSAASILRSNWWLRPV